MTAPQSISSPLVLTQPFCAAALLALLVLTALSSSAQTNPSPSSSLSPAVNPAPAKAASTSAKNAKSGWSALTASQQLALQPLAANWDAMNVGQQRKWLEISRNYPLLSTPDQTKMHSRMSEWVGLSARERAEARLNFAATSELSKELTPMEKKAKWEAYQSLSPEEKKKLAEKATRHPAGAATASRPVAAQKLATLPPPSGTPTRPAKPASAPLAEGAHPGPTEASTGSAVSADH